MRRIPPLWRSVGVLGTGHALIAVLFWWLLHVPEANVVMLALSAAIALAMLAVAAGTEAAGAFAWTSAADWRPRRWAAAALVPFVIALLCWGAFSIAAWRAADWVREHRGEIDAAIMMRTRRANTAALYVAFNASIFFFRYVIGVSLAVALLLFGASYGLRGLISFRWLRAALSRRQTGTIALAMIALIALPLRAVDWRPKAAFSLNAETAFVAAKLLAIYLLVTIGWAIVLRAGMQGVRDASPGRAATP